MAATRFLHLSQSRQLLVRLCQTVNYGHIYDVSVRDREPILKCQATGVFIDIRLDVDEQPREKIATADFALGAEVTRLIALLDKIENGKISKIEVRAGLPRRVTLESCHVATERAT